MRQVPSRLVHEEHRLSAWCGGLGNLGQLQVHRRGIAPWQDEGGAFAQGWADSTEDVGRSGALIGWRASGQAESFR